MLNNKIDLRLTYAQEFFKTNHEGQIIQNDLVHHCICRCILSNKDFKSITIAYSVSIENSQITNKNDIEKIILNYLRLYIISFLSKSQSMNIFHIENIDLNFDNYIYENIMNEKDSECRFSLLASNELMNNIKKQSNYYFLLKDSFTNAANVLNNITDFYPEELNQNKYRINKIIDYIYILIGKSYYYPMHQWYDEKISMIRIYFNDMMSRKNVSHPNYISSRDYIRRNLYSFKVPEIWESKPELITSFN